MEILGLIDVPVWLLLVVLLVVTLYLYTSKDHGYFKSVGIPGPKPTPFLGNGLDFLKHGIMEHDLNLKRQYGKAVGVFFPGNTPAMFVYDAEMLSEITVKKFQYFTNRLGTKMMGMEPMDTNLSAMEDAEWKHTRSIMTPAFTTGKLRKMATEINRCAKQLTSTITSKEHFDANDVTAKFTMDVIASTAFGLRINSQEDGDNPFVENAKGMMNISLKSPLVLIRFVCPPLATFLAKLGMSIFPRKVLNFFENVLTQTFKNRESTENKSRNDFVQLMLNAQAGEDIREEADEEEIKSVTKQNTPQGGLTNKVIVSNAFLFFFAGYHSTSRALQLLMYNLTVHPEYQDKVIEEVESNVGDEEIITYDMISAMTYLDKCLCETLRMYPPAPRSDRIVGEDVTICGVPFKKGSIVWLPIYALHNDPDVWPEPQKFDPERFSPEEKAKRSPLYWMPFGYGPRICIGLRLAMYEMKVAIAEMLREHRLVRCEKTQVPLQFVKGKYLVSEAGVWLKLEKRK